jgi:hypothetical protein
MGVIASILGAITKFLFGSEDRPQLPLPQERPPQQPQKPYRPHKPQEGRPPQSYPLSTSPPKQHQEHKPHSPRPSKSQHPVCPDFRLLIGRKLTAYTNPAPHSVILILHDAHYRRHRR